MNGIQERQRLESAQNVNHLIGIRNIGNANEFYVYIYLDSTKPGNYIYKEYGFNYEPFYVGKGSSLRHTLCCHRKNTFVGAKIRKLGKESVLTVIIYLGFNEELAFKKENEFIKLIGRRDLGTGPLCNLSNGYDGKTVSLKGKRTLFIAYKKDKNELTKQETKRTILNKIYVRSDESRQKMREAAKNRPPVTEETKRKISEAKKNISEETRQKMSESAIGRKATEKTRTKMILARQFTSEETRRKLSEKGKAAWKRFRDTGTRSARLKAKDSF